MSNMIGLILTILLLGLSGEQVRADFQLWKISRSRSKIIVKLESDEFLSGGDRLYLQNKHGSCWTEVLQVKRPFALASGQECRFKMNKGDRLVHANEFGGEPSKAAEDIGEDSALLEDAEELEDRPPPRALGRRPRKSSRPKFTRNSGEGRLRRNTLRGKRKKNLLNTIGARGLFSASYPLSGNLSFERKDFSSEELGISAAFGLKLDYLFLPYQWKGWGGLVGLSYNLGRRPKGDLGPAQFSVVGLQGNVAYSPPQ